MMLFNQKNITFFLVLNFLLLNFLNLAHSDTNFNDWLESYKSNAFQKGISQETLDITFKNVKFLEQVIKYDRKQPEFFEDTITYVNKRANSLRVKKAIILYKKNKDLFLEVEKKFLVEKEILLSLWGIETNFGKHVGKMDIISSLATLSFDKRRRDFFSSQLFTLLELIDDKIIKPEDLFGSWAGAYGNFQFMPSTMKNYAIDYDGNSQIDLKNSLKDSLASAANYIYQIGWKKNQPCFYQVKLMKKINQKYYNTSARKISNKMKVKKWLKKGIVSIDGEQIDGELNAALILPDGNDNSPTYLVFDNYEKILKWNRSLRFGISVCTLANKIKI